MTNLTVSSNSTCPPTGEPAPLSWQNAFWSLTALALNAMAQVSTADGNDAEIAFSLWRSSPLICYAEMAIMFIWAAVGVGTGTPLRDCLSLSRRHLLSDKKRAFDADGPSNFLAVVLFVLVPLPQILKIMASTGIFWTKAWAMAYFLVPLLTFPVVEPRSGFDRSRVSPSVRAKLVRLSGWLYGLVLAVYAVPWVLVITWQAFKIGALLAHGWWRWLYILPIVLFASIYFAVILPGMVAMLAAMLVDLISRCTYRLRGERLPTIVWSDQWMKKVAEPGSWNHSVLWGLVFASSHLVGALIWYSNSYDQSGTTKPSWAEKLG